MQEKLALINEKLGKPKNAVNNLKRVEFVQNHLNMDLEEFHKLVLINQAQF